MRTTSDTAQTAVATGAVGVPVVCGANRRRSPFPATAAAPTCTASTSQPTTESPQLMS